VHRKPLAFVTPPPSLFADKLKILSALTLDESKNWRLEIWRQLAKMPKNQTRQSFEQILRLDCVDEFFSQGICGDSR